MAMVAHFFGGVSVRTRDFLAVRLLDVCIFMCGDIDDFIW